MLSNPLSGGKFSWELFPGKDGWGTQSDSMGHKTTAWDTKGHKAIAGEHKKTAGGHKGQLEDTLGQLRGIKGQFGIFGDFLHFW